MAQVISTLCDECIAAGSETPGATYNLTIETPGAKPAPYVIDACEVHAKPYTELLALLAEHGRRADRKTPMPRETAAAKNAGDTTCQVCGHITPTVGGLRTHVIDKHGMSLSEAAGKPGLPCPEKGCGRTLAAIPGLMAHLRTTHGMSKDEARAARARAGL